MFFIYDCNDCIVGNHNGYKRHRDAQGQATRMQDKLWKRYDDKIMKLDKDGIQPKLRDRIVWSIEFQG